MLVLGARYRTEQHSIAIFGSSCEQQPCLVYSARAGVKHPAETAMTETSQDGVLHKAAASLQSVHFASH